MVSVNNEISEQKFEQLVAPYQDTGDAELDKTVDDVLSLRSDGLLSDDLVVKIIKLLIARRISNDIKTGVAQTSMHRGANKPNKMQFMRISYGKTEEHFAI